MPEEGQNKLKNKNASGLRTLKEKHRAVYAPGCDIGNTLIDEDAMYIHLPKHKMGFTKKEGEGESGDEDGDNEDSEGESESEEEDESDTEGKIAKEDKPEAVRMVRKLQKSVGALNDRVGESEVLLTKNKSAVLDADAASSSRRPAPESAGRGDAEGDAEVEDESASGEDEEEDDEDDVSDVSDMESEEEGSSRPNRAAESINLGELIYERKGKSSESRAVLDTTIDFQNQNASN